MEILARAVGRRKEAIAQVQLVKGTGQFIINNIDAQQYLHNNTCSMIAVKSPLYALGLPAREVGGVASNLILSENAADRSAENVSLMSKTGLNFETIDIIVKVKGGGLIGQSEAIKLGVARALTSVSYGGLDAAQKQTEQHDSNVTDLVRKQLKDKGYLTQDSRVKERRKYGLKKARKASQYHKR